MRRNDAEFLQRIRAAFQVEAREHLQVLASHLLAMEQAQDVDMEALESVFRHTHSLKGAARAAAFDEIEAVCQSLESIFVLAKRRSLQLRPHDYDLLHQATDLLGRLVEAGGAVAAGEPLERRQALARSLQALAMPGNAPPAPDREPPAQASSPIREEHGEPVTGSPGAVTRVATGELDRLLRSAEEMLSVKHGSQERLRQLTELQDGFAAWNKQWLAAQSGLRHLRRTAQAPALESAGGGRVSPHAAVLEFADWTFGYIKSLEARVGELTDAVARDRQSVGRQVDELLEQSKNLLMLPFGSLAELMPKVVRDLAKSQGKQAELVVEGSDLRIDKRILDRIKDPIIHLLRNAIDHGVQTADQRTSAGRPARARIRLAAAFLSGDKVEFVVEDDGVGPDLAALRRAAVRSGVAEEVAAGLDDVQALDLMFRSEVSTRPAVTELSGRGVGLAIVREEVEKLGGQVSVQRPGAGGARFRITLPQTLGAMRGLFVQSGGQVFVVPGLHVERVARVSRSQVRTVRNRPTLTLDGSVVWLAGLAEVLGLPSDRPAEETLLTVVFLEAGSERLALAVDDVIDDDEVLVKRLEPPLVRVRNIAGATVTPAGKIISVLNVADLFKSARLSRGMLRPGGEIAMPAATTPRARILVVEDSITSRLLLEGILNAAGYEVVTAADGIEAFTLLRSQHFDLLVSDIEMPRLDGFGLTARIRADPVLARLPVVLVTALARQEDRERGIDVGANAYIAKGSFDQRELTDAIRRLLALREQP